MSRRLLKTATLLACLAALVATTAPASAGGKGPIYAQLSSTVTQRPTDTKPTLVKMDSNDALGGIVHSDKEKTEDIVVKEAGVYFIMAAAQVGVDKGASGDGNLNLWVRVGGKDVDNSNTRQYVRDSKSTSVLVCQGIAELKAGDTINCVISVSDPAKGLSIVAIRPDGEPVIPSIIVSVFKLN